MLTATTGSGAGNGVSGNIGINITAGVANAQSNDASLASVDVSHVFGSANIISLSARDGLAAWQIVVALACIAICAPSNGQSAIGASTLAGVPVKKAVRSMREIRYAI